MSIRVLTSLICLAILCGQDLLVAQELPIDVRSAEVFGPLPSKPGTPLSLVQLPHVPSAV